MPTDVEVTETIDDSVEAVHGEKTIEISIRFFTNSIAAERGQIKPKHCWEHGVVRLRTNNSHGIQPLDKPVNFHSLMDLPRAIENVIIEAGLTLHSRDRAAKYRA